VVVRGCGGESNDASEQSEKCKEVAVPNLMKNKISSGFVCGCKGDLCNPGEHQSVGHEIIVGCVIVTAVVDRVFYY